MDTLTTVLRAGLSLVCVLALVWTLARFARRHPLNRRGLVGATEVLARQQLSRAASLAVVRVGDRTLVLGVTEQQVTLLHEGAPGEAVVVSAAPQPVPVDVGASPSPAVVLEAPARPGARTGPAPAGALAGSALSPATWGTALEVLRERTVRR